MKLDLFEATFDDNSSPSDNQIEDAIDIIQVYSCAKAGFTYLESGIEELRELICDTHEADEEEIQRDVDELDADLDLYEKMLAEIKKITAMLSKSVNWLWLNLKQKQLIALVLI